jgi:hypothetical protein
LVRLELLDAASDNFTFRIFLDLEASPPSRSTFESRVGTAYFIDVVTDRTGVVRAIEEWESELTQFPRRS